jgi:hypothetical protein
MSTCARVVDVLVLINNDTGLQLFRGMTSVLFAQVKLTNESFLFALCRAVNYPCTRLI